MVNGAKTFITSGARADFVTTAVRTGGPGYDGVSLLVVDTATRGSPSPDSLEKMGWHCSDTAELSFVDVRVPAGQPGRARRTGFPQIMRHFASRADLAGCTGVRDRAALPRPDHRLCARARTTFGAPLIARQVVRHRLAEMARVTDVARTYVRQFAIRVAAGERLVDARWRWRRTPPSRPATYVVDAAVQLHGGSGYLRESEVERHYRDARIMGIGGGTTEIMNEIIARSGRRRGMPILD